MRAGRCPSSILFVGLASNVALRYIRGARAGVPRTMPFSIHRPEHGGHIPYGAGYSGRPWPPSIHPTSERDCLKNLWRNAERRAGVAKMGSLARFSRVRNYRSTIKGLAKLFFKQSQSRCSRKSSFRRCRFSETRLPAYQVLGNSESVRV